MTRLQGSRTQLGQDPYAPASMHCRKEVAQASWRATGCKWPLLSFLQLVNRLGSTRGGTELSLQSPVLRAQEQRCREHIAVLEGRCIH